MEQQYIVRFPPSVADTVRSYLAGEDQEVRLKLKGMHTIATFTIREGSLEGEMAVGGEKYGVRVADLPCILESHKTADNQHYYKNGNIGQVRSMRTP